MSARVLIVIPTFNESRHIGALLDALLVEAEALDARVVVADGGSTDDTLSIVESLALGTSRIAIAHNRRRIQSAAINLAVEQFGDKVEYLVRVDAHGAYPPDYCRALVAEAEERRVASIVVPMVTVGRARFQRAVAAAAGDSPPEEQSAVDARALAALSEAVLSGDVQQVAALLAPGATLWSDGGGKAHAALRPVEGPEKVARFLLGIASRPGAVLSPARINGGPGVLVHEDGVLTTAATLRASAEGILGLFFVRNPDKLPA